MSVLSTTYPAQSDWQSAAAAEKYRISRAPGRNSRYFLEERIVGRWLDQLPAGATVLDVPCGTGRFVRTATERGLKYVGADISEFMIAEARRQTDSPLVEGFLVADAARLPLPDASVDCVMVWRLLHHIRDAGVRRAILSEAARVTRGSVLVSFHHPFSLAAVRKAFKRRFLGKGAGVEFTAARLGRDAEAGGLRVAETAGFRKYVSINWFARLQKA